MGVKVRGPAIANLGLRIADFRLADCRLQIGQCKRDYRLACDLRPLDEILFEILAAGFDLARNDVRRIDRAVVG